MQEVCIEEYQVCRLPNADQKDGKLHL